MAAYIVVSDVVNGWKKGDELQPRPEGYTRFALTSDTHSRPLPPIPPDTDIFLHSGDLTIRGEPDEVKFTVDQIASLPHNVIKVFVAGNHDLILDQIWLESENNYSILGEKHCAEVKEYIKTKSKVAGNMYYIENEAFEVTTSDGKTWKLYGTPYSKEFWNFAFMSDKYPLPEFPSSTEILITHGPAFKILDLVANGARGGCDKLTDAVKKLKPRMHLFGHIHEARGIDVDDAGILFVNAAALEGSHEKGHIRGVIVIDLKNEI
jgi:predicted phosphohydrolase